MDIYRLRKSLNVGNQKDFIRSVSDYGIETSFKSLTSWRSNLLQNELIAILNVNFAFGGFLMKININIINQNNKRILQPVTKAYKKSIDIIY